MPDGDRKLPVIRLFQGAQQRALTGHPWILDSECRQPGDIEPGSEVDVVDAGQRFIGRGTYNPHSRIAVRIFSRSPRARLTVDFFRSRLRDAKARRERFFKEATSGRIIYSEGDKLPGVIADRYGDVIVLGILTLGIERRREELIAALIEEMKPKSIYERSESSSRAREGLPHTRGTVFGSVPEFTRITSGGLDFRVPIDCPSASGIFHDQGQNWTRFREAAAGAAVLDLFSYHGHFSLFALSGGAYRVTSVENSEFATECLRENFRINNRDLELVVEDAFEVLRRFDAEGRRYDLISVDPPSYLLASDGAGERSEEDYLDLNARAIRLASPGGLLFTTSRSYHVSRREFIAFLAKSAQSAGREARLVAVYGASLDHPIRLEMPETDYLKCAVLRVE